MNDYKLMKGDCLERLREIPDNSVDAIVTDPPYGLGKEPDALAMLTDWIETGHHEVKGKGFMGKEWDAFVPQPQVWHECLRVLKPGGHLLAFAGTRTQDLMTLGLRLAGFEIRDMVAWVYGSGFPKSLDVSKALDKMAGVERETGPVDPARAGRLVNQRGDYETDAGWSAGNRSVTIDPPATEAAKQWDGWGTALKPALEPITLARKPLEGTVASNVLKWHTGALNIDGCRVATSDALGGGAEKAETVCATNHEGWDRPWKHDDAAREAHADRVKANVAKAESLGRWPANLIHDGSNEVVSQFPNNNPECKPHTITASDEMERSNKEKGWGSVSVPKDKFAGFEDRDNKSAARFFYAAKTSKSERGEGNNHPTVKPIVLMSYLCRLITPPGGTILDPYLGSGSTGLAALAEGFDFIGIERDDNYFSIAEDRIRKAWEAKHCSDL